MAIIKTSALVNLIRGSVGENVFAVWNGRAYCKKKITYMENPATRLQENPRVLSKWLSNRWLGYLTPIQKENWGEMAHALRNATADRVGSRNLVKPEGMVMEGYQLYLRHNFRKHYPPAGDLWDATKNPVDDAPKSVIPPGLKKVDMVPVPESPPYNSVEVHYDLFELGTEGPVLIKCWMSMQPDYSRPKIVAFAVAAAAGTGSIMVAGIPHKSFLVPLITKKPRKIVTQLEGITTRGARSTPTEVNELEFAYEDWATELP